MGDREADPPAAHAVRLAERVSGHRVVDHPRLGQDRGVPAVPDHVAVRLVGEDHQVRARGRGRRWRRGPRGVATPPVGLCGEFRKIARGRGSVARKSRDVLGLGPKPLLDAERGQHRRAPRRSQVGHVGREVRAEDQDAVAGLEQGLGEVLLERLGPGGDDDVLGGRPDSRTRPRRTGRAASRKLGQAEARAVAGLVLLDRPDAGLLGVRRAGERAVADLQLDHVLAPGLQRPGRRQHGEGGLGRQIPRQVAQSNHRNAP